VYVKTLYKNSKLCANLDGTETITIEEMGSAAFQKGKTHTTLSQSVNKNFHKPQELDKKTTTHDLAS
jgi:hypothetical protein